MKNLSLCTTASFNSTLLSRLSVRQAKQASELNQARPCQVQKNRRPPPPSPVPAALKNKDRETQYLSVMHAYERCVVWFLPFFLPILPLLPPLKKKGGHFHFFPPLPSHFRFSSVPNSARKPCSNNKNKKRYDNRR